MLQVASAGTPPDGVAADVHLVPLVARGRVLGRASFTRAAGSPPYGDADRALADELAARAALALDNVRLYDEARATAVELQRSLLPANRPRITGVEMAHRYLPGSRETEVGGDWFDVLPLSCGRVAFVIGDVMGRGLRAAAAMGQLRTAVRTLAVLDLMPDELLAQLDHLAMGIAQVQLATCVYAVFDPVTRELCFATAGHPPPLLRDPDGTAQFLPSPSGAPLGVGGVPFEAAPASVQDGARLLLYTDGLIESRGADLDDGLAALAAAFVAGPAGLDPLCDHVLDVLGRADGHDDDVAMLVAELRGLEPWRIVSWGCTATRPRFRPPGCACGRRCWTGTCRAWSRPPSSWSPSWPPTRFATASRRSSCRCCCSTTPSRSRSPTPTRHCHGSAGRRTTTKVAVACSSSPRWRAGGAHGRHPPGRSCGASCRARARTRRSDGREGARARVG